MARGINKVILIGHLGADPETRAMPSGMTVANLRMATTESWKDKQSGEQQERTEWHSVALFGRLGEIAGRIPAQGLAGLYRGQPAHPQVAGQGRPRPLHDRDRRQRDADARRAWRRGRWRRGRLRGEAAARGTRRGCHGAAGGARDEFDDDIPF